MKILIVSGFLGAGKTTFIKAFAAITGKEFAILENEYGEVGIDSDVLRQGSESGDVNIWELTEGCICCSTKGDFAASVLTIANTVDPEYLVVEPTGVGMLSNILSNLKQIEYERITLLSPVSIVDGRSFEKYLSEYPSIYKDQIREAGTVFVSKMEDAGPEELMQLKTALSGINPKGHIITEHYSRLNQEELLLILRKNFDGTIEELIQKSGGDSDILPDTFSMSGISMQSPERLFMLLEGIIQGRFGNVLRAKGFVKAGDTWFRFDLADGRYLITGADEPRVAAKDAFLSSETGASVDGEPAVPAVMKPLRSPSKVVFIGTNIRRQAIRRFFGR